MNDTVTKVLPLWPSFSHATLFKTSYPITLPLVPINFCTSHTSPPVSESAPLKDEFSYIFTFLYPYVSVCIFVCVCVYFSPDVIIFG